MKRIVALLAAVVICLSGCLTVSPDDTQAPSTQPTQASTESTAAESTDMYTPTSASTQPDSVEPSITEPIPPETEPDSSQGATEAPTQPPATQPAAMVPPATQPTATEPPVTTEPPATEPPATQSPATEPPATEPPATVPPVQDIDTYVMNMSLEELVGQLFLARCPGSTTGAADVQRYHLGGYILFGRDFSGQTPQSVTQTIASYQSASAVPLLIAVDEEGGTVTRVSSQSQFRATKFPSPRNLYNSGGLSLILQTEIEKCQLLRSLGINVNMAPVCDITTDPNAFMYKRSIGQDPKTTGTVIAGIVKTMAEYQVGSVLKHFPGYGNNTDTHTGIAIDSRSLESLLQNDLVPFQSGIQAGCGAILISHTIVECLDSDCPASLSPKVIAFLRGTMGFDGVIMTDDLAMQAITDLYGSGESAVMALEAGCDLLCSTNYATQYKAVLKAVQSGRLSEEQLRASAARILRWKHALGLI